MRDLRVVDLMTNNVVTLPPQASIEDLRDVLWDREIRHVPVVDEDGELVGVVSQRDLLRSDAAHRGAGPIDPKRVPRIVDIMTTEVVFADPNQDIGEAAQVMLEGKFGCLPVVEGTRVVGIVTEADFVAHVADQP